LSSIFSAKCKISIDFICRTWDNQNMDNELIKRFIELRKKCGPTQAKFGMMVGLSDGSVSRLESGQITLTEKHIKLICGTLGVNEAWLKEGVGSMFSEEIPGQQQLLEAFRKLSPTGRKAAIKLIEALLDLELERAFDEGVRGQGVTRELLVSQQESMTSGGEESSPKDKRAVGL
jgi:transcriptional regulator with XRE-family HTH domain